MRKAIAAIKDFSNYEIEMILGGLEWNVVDTRTGHCASLEYDNHLHCTVYSLEDDNGEVHHIKGGYIQRLIYPYLRDMHTYTVNDFRYPEVDIVNGEVWCKDPHNPNRWISEEELHIINMKDAQQHIKREVGNKK